jgi:fructose-1,6-bisphosphatase/sedoheptulose 1,7-bisphosphatase-like protein
MITDGDVAPAVATGIADSGVDMVLGIGGAPEWVLAAAAVKCTGGDMLARLVFTTDEERERAPGMGISDPDKVYTLEDMATGDVFFAATGVTSGSLLRGIRYFSGGARTHTVVMRSRSRTVRFVNSIHYFDHKPTY